MAGSSHHPYPVPTIHHLGDCALLVRFGDKLTDTANAAAIACARLLEQEPPEGVLEIVPSLISVLVRYDGLTASPADIAGQLRLRLFGLAAATLADAAEWTVGVVFDGPDLDAVAGLIGMDQAGFVAAHNAAPLRVLATGFAPGFVYCGLHAEPLVVARRSSVRPLVPAGSVLFAAGQTAIAATEMPTGWHVIGHTDFRNFDPSGDTPTRLVAGDTVRFVVAP